MATLSDALVRWVVEVVDEGATVTEVRGLRDGSSPWLLRLAHGDEERRVVLRVGDRCDPSPLRTEQTGLSVAGAHGVPVPRLLSVGMDHDPPLVLTEAARGSSAIPANCRRQGSGPWGPPPLRCTRSQPRPRPTWHPATGP
jgi:hypothetical protein